MSLTTELLCSCCVYSRGGHRRICIKPGTHQRPGLWSHLTSTGTSESDDDVRRPKVGNFHFSYDSGKWVAGIHCKFIYESVPQNWEYCFSHRSEERGERCLCDFPVPSAGVSNQREHSRPEFVLGVLNNWSHWKTPSRWVRTPAEDQGGCSKELVQDFTSSWPPHSRPYLALILSSQQLSGSVDYAVPIYRERTPLQAFNQWQTQDQNPIWFSL